MSKLCLAALLLLVTSLSDARAFQTESAQHRVAGQCQIADLPCEQFSGFDEAGINTEMLRHFTAGWGTHEPLVRNKRRAILFDTTMHSSERRLYVIDFEKRAITAYLSAHGKGSDPDHDGYVNSLSSVPQSKATPPGFHVTGNIYQGRHGASLRLLGLEDRNKSSKARAIVIHGANYVAPGRAIIGRSWGCPALEPDVVQALLPQIADGALLLIWHPAFFEGEARSIE